jgi:hypothetical protein
MYQLPGQEVAAEDLECGGPLSGILAQQPLNQLRFRRMIFLESAREFAVPQRAEDLSSGEYQEVIGGVLSEGGTSARSIAVVK